MTVTSAWMKLGFAPSIAGGACALIAACGGGSHGSSSPPDGMLDGMPVGDAPNITVRLTSTADLKLIAFRDGPSAPWQTPVATQPGRYEIAVHGPYTVLDVCTAPGQVVAFEESRTLDDNRDLDMSCLVTSPRGSHVTGSMTPLPAAGISPLIRIGPAGGFTAADGRFDIRVVDGTYDLVARTQSTDADQDRIAIRHNLVVAGDTMVTPAIDATAEGTATVAVQPTVTNLVADERLGMSGEIDTPTVQLEASVAGTIGVHVLPDAALGPHDSQQIHVVATSNSGNVFSARRVARRYAAGTSLQFTLPPAVSVPFTTIDGQLVAAWTVLPPYDQLEFAVDQSDGNSPGLLRLHVTNLSASYIAATGATSARFDTDVPGYDPSWRVDLLREYDRGALIRSTVSGDVLHASQDEDIPPQLTGQAVVRRSGGPPIALLRRVLARQWDR